MTAPNSGFERAAPPWQKRAADLCTLSRALLALALVWLGIHRGKDGVQIVFVLLLVAVTLDTLDGYLARVSGYPHQTWVGAHDLGFDLGFSAALLIYLALAGYLSPTLAALYAGAWITVFFLRVMPLSTLAVLFQGPIYLGVLLAALVHDPALVLWLALWLMVALAFAGKRFFRVRLPEFIDSLIHRDHWLEQRSGDRRQLKE